MGHERDRQMTAVCNCGTVQLEVSGAPILSVVCHCASCQEAGKRIEAAPGAPPTLDSRSGTPFILYRKDRIRCIAGGHQLEAQRLKPDSPTRRVVARCCNAAMFLEFKSGHWLSVYSGRFGDQAPPAEMRVMTKDRPADIELPPDIPNLATHSGRFMWRLLTAWVAMGFRVPKVAGLPD
jgi:hypothetical protein